MEQKIKRAAAKGGNISDKSIVPSTIFVFSSHFCPANIEDIFCLFTGNPFHCETRFRFAKKCLYAIEQRSIRNLMILAPRRKMNVHIYISSIKDHKK